MAEQYKLLHPLKYYRDHLSQDVRPDGREFNKLRPMAINLGSISSADGSAIVKIGNTSVVCGIRAELAKPKASDPDKGYLIPNIELTSLCSPKYRSSVGTHEDSELYNCSLNDILTNSECIDLKTLCIYKDKLVWCLNCDIVCLNHDGCVVDAAILAIVGALRNLRLPKVDYDPDVEKITVEPNERSNIIVKSNPVATTFIIFDDGILITDPTVEEEELSSSILTITVTNGEVCYILKPGGSPISQEKMDICNKQALKRELSVLQLLNKMLKK